MRRETTIREVLQIREFCIILAWPVRILGWILAIPSIILVSLADVIDGGETYP